MKKPLKQIVDEMPANSWLKISSKDISKEDFKIIMGGTKIRRLINSMENDSDRDLVIQCVATLERLVGELLAEYENYAGTHNLQIPKKNDNFGPRIQISFKHKLIKIEQRDNLDLLRKVRNKFAHDPDLYRIIHDDEVCDWIKQLSTYKNALPIVELSLRETVTFMSVHLTSILETAIKDLRK